MTFNKNQTDFPSESHKAIWDAGIHILPLEVTLPQEIRSKLEPALIRSCEQLQKYFLHLLNDVFDNVEMYEPFQFDNRRISLQYKFLIPFADFALIGKAGENNLTIKRSVFDELFLKQINSKTYHKNNKIRISPKQRIDLLERSGLKINYHDNDVIITNSLFPNIFYAMCEMAKISSKEKRSGDNSFTYCDFRKLCKAYKYDKFKNALIFLNVEHLIIAKELDTIAKKYKMTRSIKSGHCAGYNVIYKYKNNIIMSLQCMDNDMKIEIRFPYDVNNTESINKLFENVKNDSDELKNFVYTNLYRCYRCYKGCSGYETVGFPMNIFEKLNRMCIYTDRMGIRMPTGKKNNFVKSDDITMIEKAIAYTKNHLM